MPSVAELERKDMIKAIFARFNRPYRPEWIDQCVQDTLGMLTENFIRGCEAVKEFEEFPRNLASAIRHHGREGKERLEWGCDKCHGNPGLVFVVGDPSQGEPDHYMTPCTCPAGAKYEWMQDPDNWPEWVRRKMQKSGKVAEPAAFAADI
jgi:hypothetical protein